MAQSLTDKTVKTLANWKRDPVLGVRQLFNIEPTDQQKELIRAAWHPQARVGVSSCQGAGKSSALVWLTYLFLLTQEDCRVLITSPSYQQLSRVFASEALKWHASMLPHFQDFFVIQKDKIYIKNRMHIFAALVTASADNEESLQGGHAKSYVVLADEASGIDEKVFDLLLGTLSTGQGGRFILSSNPLRSSGRFAEIFTRPEMGKEKGGKWDRLYFSAYESPNINKDWIEEMKETYGEDSDIFRVRVLGKFPRASNSQFISSESVERAFEVIMSPYVYQHFPKVMGVDVARFGDDSTVFTLRQGPKLLDYKTYKNLDTMEVASKLFDYQSMVRAEGIYIDSIGVGAGVADRAKMLLGEQLIHPVVVSAKSTNPMQYLNLRSQLWGMMKDWIENGASLPRDEELKRQLVSMCYGYNNKMQIQLMSKKDIKKLGLDSPDISDSLSLTFAVDIFTAFAIRSKVRSIKAPRVLWA